MAKSTKPKKIVLAYSGGLDTSVILPWLKDRYKGVKLVAFAAELGQGSELKGIEEEGQGQWGRRGGRGKDLRKEFADEVLLPHAPGPCHLRSRTTCWAPASPVR
jgi:argininosuccinate synthase